MTWKKVKINGDKLDYKVNEYGEVIDILNDRVMTPIESPDGYMYYSLRTSSNKKIRVGAHRLAALMFIPRDKDRLDRDQVNHIDGDKKNNHISNLEWVTDQENKLHGFSHGLYGVGMDHPRSRYSDDQIHEVCKYLSEGKSVKEIAKLSLVNKEMIKHIKNGDNWTHISDLYDFERTKPRKMMSAYYDIIDDTILSTGVTQPKKLRDYLGDTIKDIDQKTFKNLVGNRIRDLRKRGYTV